MHFYLYAVSDEGICFLFKASLYITIITHTNSCFCVTPMNFTSKGDFSRQLERDISKSMGVWKETWIPPFTFALLFN